MSNPASRKKVIEALQALLGETWFLKPAEEFGEDYKGGIWTTNERWSQVLDGGTIMPDYEVHPKVKELLDGLGWYVDPYDAGTLFIFKQ